MSQQAKIEIESDSESLAEAAARLLLKLLVDRDAVVCSEGISEW